MSPMLSEIQFIPNLSGPPVCSCAGKRLISLFALFLLTSVFSPASLAAPEAKGTWECRSGGAGGWDCSWTGPGQPPEPEHVNNKGKASGEQPASSDASEAASPAPEAAQTPAPVENKGPAISPIEEPRRVEPEKTGSSTLPEIEPDLTPSDVAAKAEEKSGTAPAKADDAAPDEASKEKKKPGALGRFKNWIGLGGGEKPSPEKPSGQPPNPEPQDRSPAIEAAKPSPQPDSAGEQKGVPVAAPKPEEKKPLPTSKDIAPDIGVKDDPPKGVEPAAAEEPVEKEKKKSPSLLGRMGSWIGLGGGKSSETPVEKK